MRWTFWKRESTEAEKSLKALQEQEARSQPIEQPVEPPRPQAPASDTERELGEQLGRDIEATMERVTRELGAVPGLAGLDMAQARFALQVRTVRAGESGTTVLAGGHVEGTVAPGEVVGLMVVDGPVEHSDVLEDPAADTDAQGKAAQVLLEATARATTASATVVTWDADRVELVVSGLASADVTPGSSVLR